ncbi:MAG: hypothetical protein EZS28_035174, partial [Streblomastix strix]
MTNEIENDQWNLIEHEQQRLLTHRQTLVDRINKLNLIIVPPHFYFLTAIGMLLALSMCVSFFVIEIMAVGVAMQLPGTIFVNDYCDIILTNMAMLAMFIAHPLPESIHYENIIDPTATTPMMNDLSHLSSNIRLFIMEQIIDQIDSPPVIMTSSNLMDIMMKPIFCYIDSDGDGNIDDEELSRSLETTEEDCPSSKLSRYGQDGPFSGIFGLEEEYLTAAIQLSQQPLKKLDEFKRKDHSSTFESDSSYETNYEATEKITLNHLSIRFLTSAILYDFRSSLNVFHNLIVKQNEGDMKVQSRILIIYFIFTHLSLFAGVFIFIIPSRHMLFKAHVDTVKMNEICPDQSSVSGLLVRNNQLARGSGDDDQLIGFDDEDEQMDMSGNKEMNKNNKNEKENKIKLQNQLKYASEWKQEYECGLERLDEEHQLILRSVN